MKVNGMVFCLLGMANASGNGNKYRVRSMQRRAQEIINPNQFILTHSDDGAKKILPEFLVDIFETRGQLSEEATYSVLRMAMNKFLLMELNALYPDNELTSVGTELIGDPSIISPGNNRKLQGQMGTELGMEVTLTFDNEPSPSVDELETVVRDTVMSDLSYFVTNLTSHGNSELEDVTIAFRREMPTSSPTPAPVDNTNPVTNIVEPNTPNQSKNSVASNVVPATLAAATLIALVVYLIFRRKGQTETETPKGDMVYVDVENDLYSMDRSLGSGQSPPGKSIGFSESEDDDSLRDDSIFSGIDHSPTNNNARGSKSLMSGFTNASSATVQVSNKEKAMKRHKAMAMAAPGSLFAFSEEGYGPYSDDDDFDERDSPRMNPPMLANSDVSDDSQEGHLVVRTAAPSPSDNSSTLQGTAIDQPAPTSSVFGSCYGGSQATQPPSTDHVLADLQVLASTRAESPRDPTPTAMAHSMGTGSTREPTPRSGDYGGKKQVAKGNSAVSYNPFNCNPIIPSEPAAQEGMASTTNASKSREASPTRFSAKVARRPSRDSPLTTVGGDTETPLRRNHISPGQNAENEMSPNNMASMSARATHIIGGVYNNEGVAVATGGNRSRASTMDGGSRPTTPQSAKAGSRSVPTTPERQQAGGHWLSSKIPGRPPASPPGAGDYVDNLSRPSTPGGELNTSLQVSDYASEYSCLPFGRLVNRTPGSEKAKALAGRQLDGQQEDEGAFPGSGRRHAGNNAGVDGSAMYQTNAMHPLDWSYKDADVASVGDSTLSDNADGAAMPRQFLFAGKREARSPSSGGAEPKTPNSARTGGSSHASASRQLINDLVWLERKIADVRQSSSSNSPLAPTDPPGIDQVDSLSYGSTDKEAFVSGSSSRDFSQETHDDDDRDPSVHTDKNDSVMSSIACRDCYAPPGKLHIVIHSTKDGPAVHTVKEGSSLEGHIFPGDLIISVDDVDTRSFTAEQVMKMMASKSDQERKITVLHFEEED